MSSVILKIANIIGLAGFFGMIAVSILFLINFLSQKKVFFLIFLLFFSFALFAIGTLMVPGEDEILEEKPVREVMLARAEEHIDAGLLQKAEIDYKKILELFPFDTEAERGLGRVESEKFANNLFWKGRKYMRKGMYGLALSDFNLALSLTQNKHLKEEILRKVDLIHNIFKTSKTPETKGAHQ